MIDYSPFWETLEASEESWYTLTSIKFLTVLCTGLSIIKM